MHEHSRIPFNRPSLEGDEIDYIHQALDAGWLSGNGRFTQDCEQLLESLLEVPRVLLTTSCTHALEMAALLLHPVEGDEVAARLDTLMTCGRDFSVRPDFHTKSRSR